MPKIFVISAPSGAGKKTIRERVMQHIPDLRYSISMTTRAPREEDIEGVTYHFVTTEQFQETIKADGFLEWSFHLGNYYGTPRCPIEIALAEGSDVLLEIDTNGAKDVFANRPDAIGIFIIADSLEQQLLSRGTEQADEIAERMAKAEQELTDSAMYKYTVINKFGDIDSAVTDCENIIKKERNQ